MAGACRRFGSWDDQLRSNEAIDDLRIRFERTLGKSFVAPVPPTVGDALLAALEVARGHPDGAAGWLIEHGMPSDEVYALRERLRSID